MSIELRDNNLYSNGYIIVFAEGDEALERDIIPIESKEEDRWHTVTAGDRLDLIAYNKYKDLVDDAAKYWWILADANGVENPLDLSGWVGLNIFIPDILRIRTEL